MSIEPTNETKTVAAAAASTISPAGASGGGTGIGGGGGGAEEEEESTLVEISPSSSTSSPTTVSSLSPSSRGSSTTTTTTTGDNAESHPEAAAAAADSSTESSTVALVEEKLPQEQQHLQPALALVEPSVTAATAEEVQVATGELLQQQQSRNLLPIQSSSSLSTPSSSEEYYDESVAITTVTSSSEGGALEVSTTSNNQVNNNNNTAICSEQQPQQISTTQNQQSPVESALPPASTSTAPEASAPDGTTATGAGGEQRREAPIEIVQIFPSTEKATSTTQSSSATSSSSSSSDSSDKSEASTNASTTSSTSSSPSASPLAVDQQQRHQQPSTVSEKVQGTPAQDDKTIDGSAVVAPGTEMGRDQQVPQQRDDLEEKEERKQSEGGAALMYSNRGSSSSSPQLKQSSLKKYKKNNNNNEERRRVSFPKDAQLITGYLEPIDPWACVTIISTSELIKSYKESCARHSAEPLPVIIDHINALDLSLNQRVSLLSLKDQNLNHGSCEALEEVLKRVQYKCINLSHAGLDDTSASVLFDMIEYYEATNELDFSDNLGMTNKSWLACINMLKKSQALNILVARGPGISEHHAGNLAKALNTSALHTLKLEHCELTQRPLATLCNLLKRNTVLKELSLANNQLTCDDARNIAGLLRSNLHIQLLDISNNNIGDKGVEFIVTALIDQSMYFKKVQDTKRRGELNIADLSSSLNSINSNKTYFPNPYGLHQFQQTKQYQQMMLQQQNVPKKRHSKKEKLATSTAAASPIVPPAASPTVPLTPPPTPALPTVSPSPSAEEVSGGTCAIETLVQLASPETAIDALEHEVKSTNNDSGINSSVSSDVDQTNSEHSSSSCNKPVEPEQIVQKDGGKSVEMLCSDSGLQDDSGSCDKECMLDEGSDKQSLELTFDLEREETEQHVKGPKKARLAKQDSVLSEFESGLLNLSSKQEQKAQVGDLTLVGTPAVKPPEEQPMEEDLPESCTDYDDDANLKIVEENLLVDRSINDVTTSDSEKNATKEDPAAATTDNDDSAPVTPLATFKKDELQLLLEKAEQQQKQEEIEDPMPATKVATELLPCATDASNANKENNNHVENISSTSKADKSNAAGPVKIVERDSKHQPLSRSLDSTGSSVEFDSPFLSGCQPAAFPSERSFSSESLNSETSVDSNDSKSSLKYHESKFAARNGTLERQQSSVNREAQQQQEQSTSTPCGLQVLVLWNNEITRNSAQIFSDLIENTSTLEILNVGCNLLCNDFVTNIKSSVKANSSLTSLGLQGAHLSDNGAKVMAEVIEFGGNSTLQRIDLRNNNILATGLDCLNEALKSNKTVTRIDLDDVPRRVVDNAIDVGPEYSRLLNNIRAQCERNKHPPETSEPISTSIKRVRASHLSSRKISLTCSSIRASPATSTATAGEKHHHHLLDPSKKTGGRLRSPLPSPIPSPIASPVPSPSRNRFQVTRVGESASGGGSTSSLTSIGNNNASTSPSPSSTGSSPTLFFAANSRFRVVTVEEPAPASASSSSSVSNYQLGRMSSSSISPSPLAAVSAISRMPPTSSSSAPALSSFVVSPKSTPSPIAQQQPQQSHIPPPLATATITTTPLTPPTPKTTKHTRLPSTSSSTLNDSVISSASIDSPDLEVKRFMTGGTTAGGLGHPVTSGSGASRALSSTIDDSCCSSSISSSIDSIDNVLQFNNASISSTDESFDLIVSSPSSSSLSVGSVSTAPLVKTVSSPHEDSTLIPRYPEQCSTPVAVATTVKESTAAMQLMQPVNLLKAKNNSLSSLEMSTSSQESLYDVQDLSSVSVSSGGGGGGSSSLAVLGGGSGGSCRLPPPTSGNSNESTLTSIQSLDKDNQKQAASAKQQQTNTEKPPRVRKTSWIASIGNHPASSMSSGGGSSGSGSAYPPAVEKLLAIFSPSNLFSSSKSSPPNSEYGTVPANAAGGAAAVTATGGGGSGGKENATPAAANPPVRKESPMGGLFRWSTKSSSATAAATKDEEKVLKVNISPENTITPQTQLIQSQSQHSPQLPVAYNVDNIPSQLKAEIKENISPENTITNKLLVNPSSSPSPTVLQPATSGVAAAVTAATPVPTTHPKVIFRLGDDYDESEDDIDTLTSKYGRGGSSGGSGPGDFGKLSSGSLLGTSAGSTTTNSSGISIGSHAPEGSPTPAATMQIPHHHGTSSGSGSSLMNTSHLGQLARDSLTTMFKNPSLTSQDSIRSMDSLTEMTAAEQQQQQQQQHHHHHHHQQQQQPDSEDAQAQ